MSGTEVKREPSLEAKPAGAEAVILNPARAPVSTPH